MRRRAFHLINLLLALFLAGASANIGAEPSPANDAYKVNPEDVLDISVWNEPNLQRSVIVRPDGGITMPLVGNIQVAGYSAQEVQGILTERLDEFVPDPAVTVTIAQINGMKVYVTGRVAKPGQYKLGRFVDVLQGITLAGGPTAFADRKNIKIIRKNGGQETVLKFNYKQVTRGQKLDQNVMLEAGDTIIVP